MTRHEGASADHIHPASVHSQMFFRIEGLDFGFSVFSFFWLLFGIAGLLLLLLGLGLLWFFLMIGLLGLLLVLVA